MFLMPFLPVGYFACTFQLLVKEVRLFIKLTCSNIIKIGVAKDVFQLACRLLGKFRCKDQPAYLVDLLLGIVVFGEVSNGQLTGCFFVVVVGFKKTTVMKQRGCEQ